MRVLRILALVLAVLSLGLSNWPAWNLAAGLAPGPVSAGTHLGGAALVAVGVAVGTRPVSEPAAYPGVSRDRMPPRDPRSCLPTEGCPGEGLDDGIGSGVVLAGLGHQGPIRPQLPCKVIGGVAAYWQAGTVLRAAGREAAEHGHGTGGSGGT